MTSERRATATSTSTYAIVPLTRAYPSVTPNSNERVIRTPSRCARGRGDRGLGESYAQMPAGSDTVDNDGIEMRFGF